MTNQKGLANTIIIGFIFLITVLMLTAAFVVDDSEGTASQTVTTVAEIPECTYTSNSCPEGYYCYHEVSGGLRWDGTAPVETIGGDQKCHKLCESDSDCAAGEVCELDKWIQIEDYGETVSFCVAGPNGNTNNKVTNTNADSTAVDTADWLTYENDSRGYSFMYPSTDWEVEVNEDGNDALGYTLGWCNPECHSALIIKERNISATDYVAEYNAADEYSAVEKEETVMFGDVSGTKLTLSTAIGATAYAVIIPRENTSIILEYNQDEVISAVVDTFEFTEQ